MKIKDAIKLLKEEEKNGVKNIIMAYWTAEAFDRKDDSSWREDVDIVDSDYDWSADQEAIEDMLESLKP
jgi:chemotaxis regulatin CheY-phosphate phosphatase CheZ